MEGVSNPHLDNIPELTESSARLAKQPAVEEEEEEKKEESEVADTVPEVSVSPMPADAPGPSLARRRFSRAITAVRAANRLSGGMLFAHNKPIHERIRELPSGEKLISSRVTLVGGKKRAASDPTDAPRPPAALRVDISSNREQLSDLPPPSPGLAMYMKKSMSMRALSLTDLSDPSNESEPRKALPSDSEETKLEAINETNFPAASATETSDPLPRPPAPPLDSTREAKDQEGDAEILDDSVETKEALVAAPPSFDPMVVASRLSIGNEIYQPKKKSLKTVGTAAVAAHRMKARQSLLRSKSIPIDSSPDLQPNETLRPQSFSADHSPLVAASPSKASIVVHGSDRNKDLLPHPLPSLTHKDDDDSSSSTVLHVIPSRRSSGRVSRIAERSGRASQVPATDDDVEEALEGTDPQPLHPITSDDVATIFRPAGSSSYPSLRPAVVSVSEDPGLSGGAGKKGSLLPRLSSRSLLKETTSKKEWVKDYDVSLPPLLPSFRSLSHHCPSALPSPPLPLSVSEHRPGRGRRRR
jgi:hypothetical protein